MEYSKFESVGGGQTRSNSVRRLYCPARCGAEGDWKGFFRLRMKIMVVSLKVYISECNKRAYFSPAAKDGNDANRSGCLGNGDSLPIRIPNQQKGGRGMREK